MANVGRNASGCCHAATDVAAFATEHRHVLHARVSVTCSAVSTGLATTRAVILALRVPSDATGAVSTVETALFLVVLRATVACVIGDAPTCSPVVTSAQVSAANSVRRKSSATNAAVKT
jgi:hypothetical protein